MTPTQIGGFAIGLGIVLSGIGLAAWGSSCAPTGFQDQSLVQNGVRILASRATKPYALPGDAVDVSVLAYDGRTDAQRSANPEPMRVYWLPFTCVNPANDAYYACFPQLAAALASAAADAGGGALVDGGIASGEAVDGGALVDGGIASGEAVDGGALVDAASLPAPVVVTQRFQVPMGVVLPRVGSDDYGLLVYFNIACAGHLQLLAVDPSNFNPQALPIGCFDVHGSLLGPEDYVFGFTRVFVHRPDDPDVPGTTNTNPEIDWVDTPQPLLSDGAAPVLPPSRLDVDAGGSAPELETAPFAAPLCTASGSCGNPPIGPEVPPPSWELAANGQHEEIWADYYATFGGFKAATRLLYDPQVGSLGVPGKTDTNYQPPIVGPMDPRDGYIWIVVHDNRGGASWVTIPVHL